MERLAAISVDLDSLPHYCRIFGVDESVLDERARALVGEVAIPRFRELFETVGVGATFFVIAQDLSGGIGSAALRSALIASHSAGIELASHSDSHDYALSRWSRADIDRDLARAHEVIERETGVAPRGFRAPGYTLSPALAAAIEARGYEYDSSTYPAAPYYALKATVMGALHLLGRPSRAILDTPGVMLAPRVPYRPDVSAPYRRGQAKFVELPIAVSPIARVPFIGALATSLPWPFVEATFRRLRKTALFNFELHAIDVLHTSDGIPKELVARQRDAAVPVAQKLKRLKTLFSWLKEDRLCGTVLEAARRAAVD